MKKTLDTFVPIILIIIIMGLFSNFFGSSSEVENLEEVVNGNSMLVDVRTPGEFASGSAKGAVNIPLDNIERSISKFKTDKTIVVFCRSGARSSQAKYLLEKNGISNVVNGGTWDQVNRLVK